MTRFLQASGRWIYRSLRNTVQPVGDFSGLKVFEAPMELCFEHGGRLRGRLGAAAAADSAGDHLMLQGQWQDLDGARCAMWWRGEGSPGGSCAGWVYDYRGTLHGAWPQAPAAPPVICGSVLRTVAHGASPAGEVFTFIAVHAVDPGPTVPAISTEHVKH